MTSYQPPLDEIRFMLRHLADLEGLARLPGLEAASADLVDQILEEAGRFAASELAPLNATGDRQRARLENGGVRTPDGFKEAYRKFVAGGWHGLQFPEAWGGQGLPATVAAAVWEMWNSANLAFCLCPILTQAGVELLLRHGTEAQRQLYLRKLVSGEWTGTMCLTEPQAGSDVGALRTRAVREGDHYRIRGTKIYITYGEHDLTENTIHMVLARTAGRARRQPGHLAVPDPQVPGQPGRLARRPQRSALRLARAQARDPRQPDLRDVVRRGARARSAGWSARSRAAWRRCSR